MAIQATTATDRAAEIVARCAKAREKGEGWEACCPAHEDDHPSLTITPAGEKVLLHCHAGCEVSAVVTALDLTLADLFVTSPASRNGHKRIVKEYDYYDATGTLVHQTVRYEPKAFKQRRPDPAQPGEYLWNLEGIEPVLYHLPQVLEAVQQGKITYLVEGEKDAETLAAAFGVTTTCNPMGATTGQGRRKGKWRQSYTETLRGAHVVILPDNDASGLKHATTVAQALHGIAASVKVVPGLHTDAPGSDVSDWLQAGPTRADLDAAVEATPVYTVPAADSPSPAESITPPLNKGASGLAAQLSSDYRSSLVYDLTRQQWLRYSYKTRGIWSPVEEEVLYGLLRESLAAMLPDGFAWKLLQDIEKFLRTFLYMRFSQNSAEWLPFRNGAFCLETLTLEPHTPERHFTWSLPYDYIPEARCPRTRQWLHQACGGDHRLVQVLRAFAKAVVTGRVDLQRYLELLGPGGTGKGTYIRLLEALVGQESVFTTELKHLETNRFELSNVIGKRLIAITDAERYGGAVTALKAITGQDTLRLERKYKTQTSGVAEGLVIVAANEPIVSADYTSGLERRRLTIYFRYRPERPRDLLSLKDGVLQGELAPELSGVLTWVLSLPDTQMDAFVRETSAVVPSLKVAWGQTLSAVNPLAAWATETLALVTPEEAAEKKYSPVKVGVAHKVERVNSYECEEIWLYPSYRRYMDDTGGQSIALRRFTDLLKDLFENQLRLPDVAHFVDSKGSQFKGIRFRTPGDNSARSTTPRLLPFEAPHVAGDEGRLGTSDGYNEGLYGVDYECEGCEGFLQTISNTRTHAHAHTHAHASGTVFSDLPSYPSQPSLVRENPSTPSLTPADLPLQDSRGEPVTAVTEGTPLHASDTAVTSDRTAHDSDCDCRVCKFVAGEPIAAGPLLKTFYLEEVSPDPPPSESWEEHRAACIDVDAVVIAEASRARVNGTASVVPCVKCGDTHRWHEAPVDIWRCVACWPPAPEEE